jgi:hypothetical protein
VDSDLAVGYLCLTAFELVERDVDSVVDVTPLFCCFSRPMVEAGPLVSVAEHELPNPWVR